MKMAQQTALLHRRRWPTAQFEASQPGIFNAATVVFPDMAAFRARDWTRKDHFIYGPHGTPTTFELEARVALLEGGVDSLLCPSGLSAIALVYMTLLKKGDELLVPVNVYTANRVLLTRELMEWGIQVRLYDPTDLETIEFSSATKLIWIEAPCSITFEFPDIPSLTALARGAGVLSAIDNTWGAGIALRPFELGVDISVQSLTKYGNGGGDVVMGAITCADQDTHSLLKLCAMRLGLNVSSSDAASVFKGLDTLSLRYASQDASTRHLIKGLQHNGTLDEVLHPSLESAVGHDFWRRDCRAAAGIFSVVFCDRFSQADVDHFIDALRLFKIGFGWGGPRSLVLPYGRSVASIKPLHGELVRFSVGLESAEDLLDDITQALHVLPRLTA